ncbi:hypothetical protein BCL93_108172 [Onishia taeanensis]|uniref:Uncharacterized protein n=1 Tax=Onishia taeanensis TaxID=284577 RepID=A0A328XJW8_9GAMM|nr:hypothetical protein [Halomonas taeanensis]RAR59822.1 hypothetical protein BCL93_108172 [Halomonas taeanensis]
MDRNHFTLRSVTSWLIATAVISTALLSTTALAADGQDLTFQGDASFGGPHGGQAIKAALVDTASGEVLAVQSDTVSADGDPAFSFTFPGALQAGGSYAVDYWIDSNFGGGSVGTCDGMQNDHQWHIPIEAGDMATTHVESHDPSAQSPVCASFE